VKPIKLIISGGGTGGHIYPALAIAKAIKEMNLNSNILFVGAKNKMEMEKVPNEGFSIKGLWISGFKRSLSTQNLLFPLKLFVSVIHSFLIIKKFKPNVVIGTGGFASGPILKVAQWLGLPTLIQEQNSYPGITNRILSKNANRICVAYDGMGFFFPKDKIRLTGNPVRANLIDSKSYDRSKLYFDLNPKMKTLVVIGGSLGSKRINELIRSNLDFFKKLNLQVLWQCGSIYYKRYSEISSKNIFIKPFISNMDKLYAAADFIISRAGAGTISELCCIGKPILLIPSPNVTANHQYHNALALVKEKAALMIEEKELEENFQNKFSLLVGNESIQKQIKENLRRLSKPDATQKILNEIIEIHESR
jgi:UDP-N-acetylglucosamine--N-acetylmuramyl-(pentapeptide) pyrophosphoryl-undecaprenol N-acetylglucosamine transferase